MLHSCLPPCHCASSLDCLLDTYKIQTYSKIIVQVQNKKAYLYGVFYSATAMVDLNVMFWDTCTIMPFHASSVRLLSSSSPSWPSIESRQDSCTSTSSTVSDDVFTSEGASVSPRPSSSTQSEGSQKSPFGCECG